MSQILQKINCTQVVYWFIQSCFSCDWKRPFENCWHLICCNKYSELISETVIVCRFPSFFSWVIRGLLAASWFPSTPLVYTFHWIPPWGKKIDDKGQGALKMTNLKHEWFIIKWSRQSCNWRQNWTFWVSNTTRSNMNWPLTIDGFRSRIFPCSNKEQFEAFRTD